VGGSREVGCAIVQGGLDFGDGRARRFCTGYYGASRWSDFSLGCFKKVTPFIFREIIFKWSSYIFYAVLRQTLSFSTAMTAHQRPHSRQGKCPYREIGFGRWIEHLLFAMYVHENVANERLLSLHL